MASAKTSQFGQKAHLRIDFFDSRRVDDKSTMSLEGKVRSGAFEVGDDMLTLNFSRLLEPGLNPYPLCSVI